MPIVSRRDKYKGATRSAALIAIGLHVIVGIIFWNTEQGQKVKDYIVQAVQGRSAPPPKPPAPKIKRIEMAKPTAVIPKFEVKSAARVDPGFAPVFKEISAISSDVQAVNFTSMAQNYSVKTFSLDKSQISNVTSDILNVMGVGDLMSDTKGTKVSGVGKRMRARLNFCLVSTPGSNILGGLGRKLASSGKVTETFREDSSKARVTWDYLYRKYNSIDRSRAWLKENTQIQVTENTITLNLETGFEDWKTSAQKKGALTVDSSSSYLEATAIKRLEKAIEVLTIDKFGGRREFVDLAQKCVNQYIEDKYEIKDPVSLTPDLLIKKIEDRNLLREWRKRGLFSILTSARGLNPDMSQDALLTSLNPLYNFFKKAQALENPLIIIANPVGLEKVPDENLDILRNYVRNGGFIWIDETGIATSNVRNQDVVARNFIYSLMNFDMRIELTDKEQETFQKLASDDKTVQGYILGDPFPNPAHPQAFIPITLPQTAPVTVRIFNRLGIPVKQFVWTKENPMKAGAYIKKELALTWNCDNNDNEPVESGNYFLQMQSGLFQKTKVIRVSKLRMLDSKHPIMSVVHNFQKIPTCTIENSSTYWETRPYGNAAFGYYLNGRMVILYTEGAGIAAGLGDLDNAVAKDMASKFLNNIIAFCLSDEDGVAIRP